MRSSRRRLPFRGYLLALCCALLVSAGCRVSKAPSESWSESPRSQSREHDSGRASAANDAAFAGGRYDLSRDEARGGHTLRKHVGRTDDELRDRLNRERDISAASTWTDRDSAETTVAAALKSESSRIQSWQQRGDRRPNLALHFDAGRVIGRSIIRGSDQSTPCTSAVIVLRADGDSFFVLTTYPEARE
jgi:hypothetical protein